MTYRLGVDVGGTFTDVLLIDERTGGTYRAKTASTPDDQSVGVLRGIEKVCGSAGITLADITQVLHGTTVATNAILEGKGARVGLVTTRGFRQVLQIARSFVPGGLAGRRHGPGRDRGAAGGDGRRTARRAADLQHGAAAGRDPRALPGRDRAARPRPAGGAVSTPPPDDAPGPGAALAANYARGGFGQSLAWGSRPALVMVDLIRAYFEPGAAFYMGSDACLHAAARVLAAARAAAIPVLYTRVEYDKDGVNGGLFVRKIPALRHLVPGGPLGEIMPQIAPGEHEVVIVKQYASAFFGTTLAATLNALGVDTVIITGVSTSGCVRATAVDALQHGFVPLVVRQAVGDRDPGPHESALFDLQAKYAEVVDEDSVVSWLGQPLS
jgi:maleamate amidohydrolase